MRSWRFVLLLASVWPKSDPRPFETQEGRGAGPAAPLHLPWPLQCHLRVAFLCFRSCLVPLTSNALLSSPWNPSRSPLQHHFLFLTRCPVLCPAGIGPCPVCSQGLAALTMHSSGVPPRCHLQARRGRGGDCEVRGSPRAPRHPPTPYPVALLSAAVLSPRPPACDFSRATGAPFHAHALRPDCPPRAAWQRLLINSQELNPWGAGARAILSSLGAKNSPESASQAGVIFLKLCFFFKFSPV